MKEAYREVSLFIQENTDWNLVIEEFLYTLDDPDQSSTQLEVNKRTFMRDGINLLDRALREYKEDDNDDE